MGSLADSSCGRFSVIGFKATLRASILLENSSTLLRTDSGMVSSSIVTVVVLVLLFSDPDMISMFLPSGSTRGRYVIYKQKFTANFSAILSPKYHLF